MAKIGAVKIPPYNFSDPALWFHMCESTFALGSPKPITESTTKFNYVVTHLPPEVASMVRDIIISPDCTDPYGHIKVELIKRSSQQELRKLLAGEQLGDHKPSKLLRVLKRWAENFQIPDAVILELFIQHLLTSVESILAAITPLDIDKAVEVADHVVEVTPATIASVSQPEKPDTISSKILVEIDKLNKRMDQLMQARLDRSDHFSRRSCSNSGHRNNSTHRSINKYCWYHNHFGAKAQKCTPLCSFTNKRERRSVEATCTLPEQSRHLFILDKKTNINFLVNTGSNVSIFPVSSSQKKRASQMTLMAASTTAIHVYDQRTLTLDFGLKKIFRWKFLIGNVSTAIIGADFLYHFHLVPNLKRKCLTDVQTKVNSPGKLLETFIHSIKITTNDSVYHKILEEFPEITRPHPNKPVKHNVVHHIETIGPSVTAKPRRLARDRLKIAKAEFDKMIALSHM
ncbi:uncharacterized protein LOC111630069 [Centruroides sculpturatus]|uniref:uncharacterized protein LOC111630069 n=1 Tax=Centruroides sculpturatus TaxID=218467 RepID=UPI000C6ECE8F|nr:uncharacterized protein LOC111630069 [Centruroides sculpturatus]